MKRIVCAAVLAAALASASCGGGSSSLPTPRPSGQRGTLLNPVDKTRGTVDRLDQQQEQQESQTDSSDYDNP